MNKTDRLAPSLTTLRLVAAVALIGTVAAVDPAFAQSAGGAFQPIETAFGQILAFLTGSFATTAATIAVAVAGYLALTSRIPWMMCFSIIVAIAFIFGATQIVGTLSGGLGGG
ncbi:TrbC/VirB2 family protein [Microvirga tunisiensis]|uniref:TrbC/VirB2 family protein n=1 Tax=Microvirga tunisiensis TaxID=2108360 RepID=A0A5N7MSQ2_9HYPH|nr:TrbC/VirB2 family protein [Microvirga tunisiensis]MPR08853.1 TrbC/VirB2 family protein [Microvirga tunisiensis]MPR27036.1 TrbC/VirB2 family protein [Microvirga tunisiensis]